MAQFILNHLFEKTQQQQRDNDAKEILVEFSVHELRDAYLNESSLFKMDVDIEDVENALFYFELHFYSSSTVTVRDVIRQTMHQENTTTTTPIKTSNP